MSLTDFDPSIGPAAQELGSFPPPPPPDPELEPAAPTGGAEPDGEPPMVDEGMVRSILAGLGNMASMVDRAAPGLWQWTEAELDAITPPFTRLANQNATLRRALLQGDYVLIAMTLSSYTVRNVTARKEAIDAQRQRNKISGGPGPAGSSANGPSPGANGGQPHGRPTGWGAADGAPAPQ